MLMLSDFIQIIVWFQVSEFFQQQKQFFFFLNSLRKVERYLWKSDNVKFVWNTNTASPCKEHVEQLIDYFINR